MQMLEILIEQLGVINMGAEKSNYVWLSRVDDMKGHEFERWCAYLLENIGYRHVRITPGSGDQGVDITAEKDGKKYAIQCKRYNNALGNKPIQEVYTGMAIYHCDIGAVMTNSTFTSGARSAAASTGVRLWDRTAIIKMVSEANKLAKQRENEKNRANTAKTAKQNYTTNNNTNNNYQSTNSNNSATNINQVRQNSRYLRNAIIILFIIIAVRSFITKGDFLGIKHFLASAPKESESIHYLVDDTMLSTTSPRQNVQSSSTIKSSKTDKNAQPSVKPTNAPKATKTTRPTSSPKKQEQSDYVLTLSNLRFSMSQSEVRSAYTKHNVNLEESKNNKGNYLFVNVVDPQNYPETDADCIVCVTDFDKPSSLNYLDHKVNNISLYYVYGMLNGKLMRDSDHAQLYAIKHVIDTTEPESDYESMSAAIDKRYGAYVVRCNNLQELSFDENLTVDNGYTEYRLWKQSDNRTIIVLAGKTNQEKAEGNVETISVILIDSQANTLIAKAIECAKKEE